MQNAMASTNATLRLAQNIITITFGGSLFVCNAFAGSLIFYAMRRKSTTFVLVAAMLAADAIYGMAYILNATYSLSLVGMDGMRFTQRKSANLLGRLIKLSHGAVCSEL